MNAIAAADRWILARLRARPGLAGVRVARATAGPGFSGVLIRMMTAEGDQTANGWDIVVTPLIYQVVAIADGEDVSVVRAWAEEIDAALHQGSGSNPDGNIDTCIRDRPVGWSDRSDPARPREVLGGLYRLLVRG